jgi:hypothetical protein
MNLFLFAHVLYNGAITNSSVVDQDVDATPTLVNLGNQCLSLLLISNIQGAKPEPVAFPKTMLSKLAKGAGASRRHDPIVTALL